MAGKTKKKRTWHFPKRRWRRHKDRKVPIAPLIGLASMFLAPNPSGTSIMQDVQAGDWDRLGYDLRERFTLMDNTGKFRFDWILPHYGPLIAGIAVHAIAAKAGVNRYFKNIPVIGKYLSI